MQWVQKLVFWSAAVCCLTELSFEKVQRYKIVSHDWLMMTLERRHDLMTVLKPYFYLKDSILLKVLYFIKAIDHTSYGFTGVITHAGCWENTRKACKSRAEGEWFTSFSIDKSSWSIDKWSDNKCRVTVVKITPPGIYTSPSLITL